MVTGLKGMVGVLPNDNVGVFDSAAGFAKGLLEVPPPKMLLVPNGEDVEADVFWGVVENAEVEGLDLVPNPAKADCPGVPVTLDDAPDACVVPKPVNNGWEAAVVDGVFVVPNPEKAGCAGAEVVDDKERVLAAFATAALLGPNAVKVDIDDGAKPAEVLVFVTVAGSAALVVSLDTTGVLKLNMEFADEAGLVSVVLPSAPLSEDDEAAAGALFTGWLMPKLNFGFEVVVACWGGVD